MRCLLFRRLPLVSLLLITVSFAILPRVASAHPLGNFTVNRYSRLHLEAQRITLLYIVDMAEIPAFQERATIDTDHDGAVSAAEQTQYLSAQRNVLQRNLRLTVNSAVLALEPVEQSLEFPDGQGGLKTQRLTLRFAAALPGDAATVQAEYRDENYVGRLGWREVVVRADDGVDLSQSSAPAADLSDELRTYPQDLLQSPLDVAGATFTFVVGDRGQGIGDSQHSGVASQQLAASSETITKSQDQFAALINREDLGLGGLLAVLATAFGLGALHALAPGHGKTIVAAYLVGARGTAKHALFLGLTTTITHTAGVFLLGLVTLFVAQWVLPEQLYPWLGVLSGALVVGIGVSLVGRRLRKLRWPTAADDHSHEGISWLDHEHGPNTHTHAPPSSIVNRQSSIVNLLALGVSGGIIPCPSALVVLLSAIALGRVGFGLLLISAFSLGLASVLTGIGLLLVHAGRLAARIPTRGGALQVLPIISAAIITVVGVGITVQALAQTGLFS